MTSSLTWKPWYFGERAHNVGRSESENSPRSDDPLPLEKRDDVENLLLLCASCHNEVDPKVNLDVFTVQRLRELKHRHEARIEQILSIPPENSTAVIRMQGTIGGDAVAVPMPAAAAAVLLTNRYARFPLAPDRSGLEIDLRRVSNPKAGNAVYYGTCQRAIDAFFQRQFVPAVDDGTIQHVSVFGLARWPLLVHFGHRLGDKLDIEVFQKHRTSRSWGWPVHGEDNRFSWSVQEGDCSDDVVLVLSLSATVDLQEIPEALKTHVAYRVYPDGNVTPHYDVIGTADALASAARAFRDILSDVELSRKHVRRVHVLGAAPLSACISLGRAITPNIHPKLLLYDRVDGAYQLAMEVN